MNTTDDRKKSFKFLGYELREATPNDLALATEWTQADPEHAGKIEPEFWIQEKPMKEDPGAERYILTDPLGAVFFLRIERVARLYIQFGPSNTEQDFERTRSAMTHGMEWLTFMLARTGIRETIFDSKVGRLRAFCKRRLRFRAKEDTLSQKLPVYTVKPKTIQTT